MMDPDRARHYADFLQPEPPVSGERPFGIVVGNCQTESLRILLASTHSMDTIRIPPVFEWTPADLERVQALLDRVDVLVVQPIHDDYRDMAAGTEQLESRLRGSARSIRIPSLRYAGLHPFQVIARDPADPSLDPPLVPYHDLRTIVAAHRGGTFPEVDPDAEALRAAERESIDQLRRREQHHRTVQMSDVLTAHPHWHTINHPDNQTLITLAERVCAELGASGTVVDPGRELLGSVEAPVEPAAVRALAGESSASSTVSGSGASGGDTASLPGLREGASGDHWRLAGDPPVTLSREQVASAQLEFCRERPELVASALDRYADRLEILGLRP